VLAGAGFMGAVAGFSTGLGFGCGSVFVPGFGSVLDSVFGAGFNSAFGSACFASAIGFVSFNTGLANDLIFGGSLSDATISLVAGFVPKLNSDGVFPLSPGLFLLPVVAFFAM
jgi:hypothetical protein